MHLTGTFPKWTALVILLPWLMVIVAGCSSIPKVPVNSSLLGETIKTTVDSEIARYYLEDYLTGSRKNPGFDKRIDSLHQARVGLSPTREDLKQISLNFSVDFAAVYLARTLYQNKSNKKLQDTFHKLSALEQGSVQTNAGDYAAYLILFVPGWDYKKNGPVTGADLASPRKLVSNLGVENYLVQIPPNGSVEDNAAFLSKEIMERSKSDKKIIIVGPSSAGPAIHLSLGKQVTGQALDKVVAWINLGGILQGSPLLDTMQKWPHSWLLNTVIFFKGWDKEKVMSMSVGPSRKRFDSLTLSDNILVVNYLGLSLSGQLSKYSRDKYPRLAPEGPNDGLTLLADIIAPGSQTIVALGSDHFFAEDPLIDIKTVALTKLVISLLESGGVSP